MKLSGDHHPTIVVATHKVFMREFYYIVSSSSAGAGVLAPDYHNTGMARYRITYNTDDGGGGVARIGADLNSDGGQAGNILILNLYFSY